MALLRCLDMLQSRQSSVEKLSSRVLYLEQMLTTGGGWQDQLGGLVPGIKLLETEPGFVQEPRISPVQMSLAAAEELKRRLLVCFVGERRLAKNILRQIMRRYLSRVPEELVCAMGDLAAGFKLAGEGGGGFMEIIAKDEGAAQEIQERLRPRLEAKGGRF